MRVISTLIGTIIVDAWLLYKGSRCHNQKDYDSFKKFSTKLAEQLVYNKFSASTAKNTRKRKRPESDNKENFGKAFTDYKQVITRMMEGGKSSRPKRVKCTICMVNRQHYVCNTCGEFVCKPKNETNKCWITHITTKHDVINLTNE